MFSFCWCIFFIDFKLAAVVNDQHHGQHCRHGNHHNHKVAQQCLACRCGILFLDLHAGQLFVFVQQIDLQLALLAYLLIDAQGIGLDLERIFC